MHRLVKFMLLAALVLPVLALAAAGLWTVRVWTSPGLAAIGVSAPPADVAAAQLHAVHINRPMRTMGLNVLIGDGSDETVHMSCSTCHSVRAPNPRNRRPADFDAFHRDMVFAHGELACLACHNAGDYDTFRLADQSVIELPDVMTLCAQCHGTQARSYNNGAHGGMSGHWDLSRGGRTRNNCIDCHDPHAPKFPMMYPTFKPRDRFLSQSAAGSGVGHE